jgi:Flp pilus assembly protein TadG
MVPVLEKAARVLVSLTRNCTRNDDGAVLVEAAIVLPVIVLVILGGLDLGLGMLTATRLNFATESAAACGALAVPGFCPDSQSTQTFAAAQSGLPANAFTVSQTPPTATVAGMETVSASYAYSFVFLSWISITLQSSAQYPIQPTQTQTSS